MENIFYCKEMLFIMLFPALKGLLEYLKQNRANIRLSNAVIKATQNNFSQENIEEIKKCLEQGATLDYEIERYNKTTLMLAIGHSSNKLIDYLLEQRADVNIENAYERTPLHYALQNLRHEPEAFNKKILEKLLKHGANPNAKRAYFNHGSSPLSWVAQHGYEDLTKLLIQYGADINQKDSNGCTPLGCAISAKKIGPIQCLCHAGASLADVAYFFDYVTSTNHKFSTAFHLAVYKELPPEYIKTLITHARLNNPYDKKKDKQIKETALTTLLVLKKWEIPHELQLYTLAKLPIHYLYGINKKLYRELLKYHKDILLSEVENRIKYLTKVLQFRNLSNKTALDLLNNHQNPEYKSTIQDLLNATKLDNDWKELRNAFFNKPSMPDTLTLNTHNLALQIYKVVESEIR